MKTKKREIINTKVIDDVINNPIMAHFKNTAPDEDYAKFSQRVKGRIAYWKGEGRSFFEETNKIIYK